MTKRITVELTVLLSYDVSDNVEKDMLGPAVKEKMENELPLGMFDFIPAGGYVTNLIGTTVNTVEHHRG